MPDTLRSRLIRLAHARPDIRADIIPLVADGGKTAAATRGYYPNAASEIAGEVVSTGRSRGWAGSDMELMSEIAEQLAKFNIGYVDDMWGDWAFVRGGTPNAFKR
jgi:hypothetical protein